MPLDGNAMRVAKRNSLFRMRGSLPARERIYGVQEVLDAVDALHPAIEIPDSRYDDFARVGAPQLIADNACACWLMVGEATTGEWRPAGSRSSHVVETFLNGKPAERGTRRQRPARPAPRADLARERAQNLRPWADRGRPGDHRHVHRPGSGRARRLVPRGLRGVWLATDGSGLGRTLCQHFSVCGGAPPPTCQRSLCSRRWLDATACFGTLRLVCCLLSRCLPYLLPHLQQQLPRRLSALEIAVCVRGFRQRIRSRDAHLDARRTRRSGARRRPARAVPAGRAGGAPGSDG